MPLPSSGAISLSEIQTEFGGSNPISISEYYGADTGVPASGTISMSDFYGTSAASVIISADGQTFTATNSDPSTATMILRFDQNGRILTSENGGANVVVGSWWSAAPESDIGADYEVSFNGGSTWNVMSVIRSSSTVSRSTPGTTSSTLDVRVRDVATATTQDIASITLEATVVI